MANSVSAQCSFRWSNGNEVISSSAAIAAVPAGTNAIENIQNIGTSAEAIVLGDVSPGILYFKNLDPTNYVDIGAENTAITPIIFRLNPGDAVIVPTSNGTWYAKAHTGACDLLVIGSDA